MTEIQGLVSCGTPPCIYFFFSSETINVFGRQDWNHKYDDGFRRTDNLALPIVRDWILPLKSLSA